MNDVTSQEVKAQHLYDELAGELMRDPQVGRRSMFGHDGLAFDGVFFAFLNHDRLALKLPESTMADLLSEGIAESALSLSRTMHRWVQLPIDVSDMWRPFIGEACQHAASLEPHTTER
jgi:hypothetical protein